MNPYSLPVSLKTKILNLFRNVFKISFLENWLIRKTMNMPPEYFFVKLIPPNYSYQKNTIRDVVRNQITYSLDLSDYFEHSLYWGIRDDGHELLYDKVKKGMTVFDIGANIGDTTFHFAQLTGNSGIVFSFEPNVDTFNKLQKNISRNRFKNIQAFMIGLGNKTDVMKLYEVDPFNKGRNRMFLTKSESAAFTDVHIKKLDDLINQLPCKTIDFIKIDVEGFEFEVLKGSINCLLKYKPILFIELNDSMLRVNHSGVNEVCKFLLEIGYSVRIAQSGEEITSDTQKFSKEHFDILCIHQLSHAG